MFLLICKLYICIQNVFGHIFYSSRLHLYWQFWQFEVQKLAYMLILAAGGSSPYLSSVPRPPLPILETLHLSQAIRGGDFWAGIAQVTLFNHDLSLPKICLAAFLLSKS